MDPERDVVVIVTQSADHFTVDRVTEAVRRRGLRVFRLDSDRFPSVVRLTASYGAGAPARHEATVEGEALRGDSVRAVWIRQIWTPRPDEAIDTRYREACERQSWVMLRGFLDGLAADARWISEPRHVFEATDKLRQLRTAEAAGLVIPRTVVTNDEDEVRAFYRESGGSVVGKLLVPLSTSMERAELRVRTREIREEDLAGLSELRHAPMIFQERVPKAGELRIAYVSGRCLVGEIDASRSAGGKVDWRESTPEECRWRKGRLPAEISARIDRLMRTLGLRYGAVDMIRRPDGEHVFLEVNPTGEWGMLERDAGLEISGAIAEALLDEGDAPAAGDEGRCRS